MHGTMNIKFVALVTQHAMRIRHIVICGLSASTMFFCIFKKGAIFGWKKCYRI